MTSHAGYDAATRQYTGGLASIWGEWQPWLQTTEDLLKLRHSPLARDAWDEDDSLPGEVLHKAQYHAHAAAELASGLVPFSPLEDVHAYLVAVFTNCRETLGAIATQCDEHYVTEAVELDTDTRIAGIHALEATREAYSAARAYMDSAMVHGASHREQWLAGHPVSIRHSRLASTIWVLACVLAVVAAGAAYVMLLLAPGVVQ